MTVKEVPDLYMYYEWTYVQNVSVKMKRQGVEERKERRERENCNQFSRNLVEFK